LVRRAPDVRKSAPGSAVPLAAEGHPLEGSDGVERPDQKETSVGRVPKFVIEREIPGVGKQSPQELHAIAQKSCDVLRGMGPQIQWIQSYVTDDTIYCVYIAPDEAAVREHARQGGFPANKVARVRSVIDPTTSE
jgi:hypothetical protein